VRKFFPNKKKMRHKVAHFLFMCIFVAKIVLIIKQLQQ